MQRKRFLIDWLACKGMKLLTIFSVLLVVLIAYGLFLRSLPILVRKPLSELIFSSSWRPLKGEFGLYSFIAGTAWVTAVAMLIAVPLCLLTSLYLSEYAPKKLKEWSKALVDLLAGIPSGVYGVWGRV